MADTTTKAERLAAALEAIHAGNVDSLLAQMAAKSAAAELRRLAGEVERANEARRKAQAQREADYTRLMAEAKREQRERGRLAAEVEAAKNEAAENFLRAREWAERCGGVQAEADALRADAERLDSGCILTQERDEFGEPYQRITTGIDLRAAIDAAKASGA